ncbi:MAG: metallophosphoesterase [Myxococcota bacterium]|nr:metallophosphoesterase [Myxococcota bacterium]
MRATGPSKLVIDGVEQKDNYQRVNGSTTRVVQFAEKVYRLPPRRSDGCGRVRFVALGDGRAHVDHIGPSAYWPGLLQEVYQRTPAFILNTGDLVKRGHRIHEWANFFRQTKVIPPMVSVRGNHDRGGLFEELIAVDRFVHWFRWESVGIIGFDTEVLDNELDHALTLLDRSLASLDSHWKVLFLHRPIWSRGNHGSNERGWNEKLIPIIDRHSIDLVLAGHDHNYERFCASRGAKASSRCSGPGLGTTYVVTGGAATFTNPVPGVSRKVDRAVKNADASASRIFSGAHHFIELSVSAHRLSAIVHRTRTGNLFGASIMDKFTLNKKNERCQKTSR